MRLVYTRKTPVGLIGYGYWGPNLLRNLMMHGGFDIVGIVEKDAAARQRCELVHGHLDTFPDLESLMACKKPNAMVIATPPCTHKEIAIRCLEAQLDILVEKPLATSVKDCDEILALAESRRRKVMVDHTFVYHPAVQYLARQVHGGEMGKLLYFDSVRVNLGKFQTSTNVLWDLGPHDLSILDYLLQGKMPRSVSAIGVRHFNDDTENIAYVHLTYDENFVAHLHLNWVSPVKIRTIVLGGMRKMTVYDDNLPTEKIKVYDKGLVMNREVATQDIRVNYRMGDMVAPTISSQEALANVIASFHDYIVGNRTPALDGAASRRIVAILQGAQQSMNAGGQPFTFERRRDPNRQISHAA